MAFKDEVERNVTGDRAEYGDGAFESGFMGGRRPAWHGLGTVLDEDVVTAERAIELAGLDWEVIPVPIEANITAGGLVGPNYPGTVADDQTVPISSHRALLRSSDHAVLGVVGHAYTPVQNREAFAFMDALVDSGEAKYHTAGSLKGGKRVWLLARVGEGIRIGGLDDELIDPFILLSNGHDGRASLTVTPTPVRVVCQNTVRMALKGSQVAWVARHTSGVTQRVSEARRTLGLTFTYYQQLEAVGNELVARRMSVQEFARFMKRLMPLPKDDPAIHLGERAATNRAEARAAITGLFRDAPNLENVRGTRWAALQAVVEWSDWGVDVRGGRNITLPEARFLRHTGPEGLAVKDAAMAMLAN